ncbi:MAG TPA: MFS transporter [Burkholderiales bacterium]|nr:MFS transporter [Burkholderiales bacterium]
MPIAVVLTLSSLSFVCTKGFRVLATLFAASLGAGPFEIAVVFALWGLFPFVLSVWAGRLADRFDNRRIMYYGLWGFTGSLALPWLFPSMTALYISAAAGGLTSMIFVVASQNLVGVLSGPEKRTRYFSYYSLGESTAAVGGPILVGVCIDAFAHPRTFLMLTLVCAVCLVILFARSSLIPNTVPHAERKARGSAKDLLALPALRNALIANGIVMTGLDLFNLYMPIYTHGLGLSATAIGLIMGAFGAAAFITRLAIPPITRRWGEHAMITGALVLAAIGFVAVPFMHYAPFLALASFLIGLGIGAGQPLTMILSFNAAPPARAAEAIAMRLAVSYGAHVVIPPVFGAVGAALGVAPIFWTCAMLLGGGSLVTRKRDGARAT